MYLVAAAALVEEMRRNIEEESYLATVAGSETIEFLSLNNTATEEWKLTLDSYIKFQLRRQVIQQLVLFHSKRI
jgi:ABC-type bacteriocin/lantibiotic exporter with double-glycine peptidase domain